VLPRNEREFFAQNVATGNLETTAIANLYNDDFLEIDEIICRSISQPRSGLILLHGHPRTGKTSYIKHLISSYPDKTFFSSKMIL
jgi:hypothetical protein